MFLILLLRQVFSYQLPLIFWTFWLHPHFSNILNFTIGWMLLLWGRNNSDGRNVSTNAYIQMYLLFSKHLSDGSICFVIQLVTTLYYSLLFITIFMRGCHVHYICKDWRYWAFFFNFLYFRHGYEMCVRVGLNEIYVQVNGIPFSSKDDLPFLRQMLHFSIRVKCVPITQIRLTCIHST